jgi:hypothetical protein
VPAARAQIQIFGAAFDSEGFPVGQLGLSPSLSGWDSPYPYLLDTLYYQGFIQNLLGDDRLNLFRNNDIKLV